MTLSFYTIIWTLSKISNEIIVMIVIIG